MLALLVLINTQLVSAAPPDAREPQRNLDHVRLQLKWRHQFQFAGYYAALAKGYYRSAGLDVEIEEGSQGKDTVNEVLRGSADFGIGTSDLVVRRSKGEPVVVLVPIFQHSAFVIMASMRSGIESIQDLAGKKVAMEPQAAELRAYMQSEGLDTNQAISNLKSFDISPLMTGELDAISAYVTDEPYLLKQAGVKYISFDPRAGGIDFYGDTLFTSAEQLRKNPKRVRAFVDASVKGWKYALANPDEIIDLICTRYSQRHSREHLRFEADAIERLVQPGIINVGYINPQRWKFIAETYAGLGMIPADFSLDGFLYDRNPQIKLFRFYATIAGLALLLLVTGFIGFRFFSLSRRLRLQISEREKAEQGLRWAEERYRKLVEQAPFPISISAREDGAIQFFNPRAAEIFKIDPSRIAGLSSVTFYTDPDDRRRMIDLMEQKGTISDFETQLKRSDGEVFWAYMSVSKIVFDGKEAYFCAFNDITARKQTEAERDRLIAELRCALAEIHILSGLIPICSCCKRIRDDHGYWQQVESYISRHTGALFSHGICPECLIKEYPLYAEALEQKPTANHAPH